MNWFRKLLAVVRNYDIDQKATQQRMKELENLLRERTEIHADLGFSDNFVIVVGRYRDRDYIRVHALPDGPFTHIVEMLREQQRYARLRVVDTPPIFSACIKRDLWQ